MLHGNPASIRARIRAALCHHARQWGNVYRPVRDQYGNLTDDLTPIGSVAGYPYSKAARTANIVIALAGRLDTSDQEGDYLMVLYGSRAPGPPGDGYNPPDAVMDDVVEMDGKRYKVLVARLVSLGAYQVWQIKEA